MKNWIIAIFGAAIIGLASWVVVVNSNTTKVQTPTSQTPVSGAAAGVLDMSNQGLAKVGPDIYNKTATTQLILSHNALTSLPSEMGRMTNVRILKLDHNKLDGSLIGEIRKMPLVTLDASYNQMTGVPAEIGQLSDLETLDYSYNKISALPNEIANLKQLKTFNLTGNPLSSDKITKLKSDLPNTTIIF